MIKDLLLVTHYFESAGYAFYEEDLKDRYGAENIRDAIRSGLLEHRRIPCGKGRHRCVCWLSEKGCRAALAGGG